MRKRLLIVLSAFALLGTLFVIASAGSPVSADEKECPSDSEVTQTTKPDCKPKSECPELLDIDRETYRQLRQSDGWNESSCCIDWDFDGDVLSWQEQYRCETPACAEEFGEDFYRITENWGNWVDEEACCIAPTDGDTLPQGLRQYTCIPEEPEPTPTEVPTETPTEEPVPPTIIVPAPEVIVVPAAPSAPPVRPATPVPAFTG